MLCIASYRNREELELVLQKRDDRFAESLAHDEHESLQFKIAIAKSDLLSPGFW